MSAAEETTAKVSSSRLTIRQKFWLFGVGLPVLLMIVLLAVAVFLPKPLNPTEQKLLGTWEVVEPKSMKGHVIEFDQGFLRGHIMELNRSRSFTIARPVQWRARKDWISVVGIGHSEFWSRLRLSLGLSSNEDHYRIRRFSENELQIEVRSGGVPITLKRIESTSP